MHWIFEKLIFKGAMLQNILRFTFEIKSYASKQQTVLTLFEQKTNNLTTSTSGKCSSLATNPTMLQF
jgi:hypothetical protein